MEEQRRRTARAGCSFWVGADLKKLLEERWEARNGPFVFHRDGERIGYDSLEHARGRARKRTKITDRLMHDLRRTGARDFGRAGVSERELREVGGGNARSMEARCK